jgi:hypothetical protein
MPFGAQRSDLQHYYYEAMFSTPLNLVIAQGSNAVSDIYTVSMPWAGDILVDGWMNAYYDSGATILNMSVGPATSIAPSNYFTGVKTEADAYGGWISVPFFGRWANLAANTYFLLSVRTTIGACNGRAVASHFSGTIRLQAT